MIAGFARADIAAETPAAEADRWAAFLGRPAELSAQGASFSLTNISLRIRRPGDGESPGLVRVAFAVDNLQAARDLLARRGASTTVADGEALLAPETSHGPAFSLVAKPQDPPATQGPVGIDALDHLVVRTGNPERAIALYGARLGLDFRLDRSNPTWGARLLFFRCGDAVVEVSAPLPAHADSGPGPDRLSGLAFRTRDPDAARARLAVEGFDVSEVRPGRKPGTRVFTLRAGLTASPMLVLSSSGSAP